MLWENLVFSSSDGAWSASTSSIAGFSALSLLNLSSNFFEKLSARL